MNATARRSALLWQRVLSSSMERGHRVGQRRMKRDNSWDLRTVRDLLHDSMRPHYPHFSTQTFQFLRGRHQGSKSCAIDALHVRQIHNDLRHVLLDQVLNRRFQLFSSAAHANAPRKVQHYDIGLHLFLLDFEHRANSSGNGNGCKWRSIYQTAWTRSVTSNWSAS